MTKKKTGIYAEMSPDEVIAYNEARRGRSHRELLLSSVGIDANPRPLGRPRFKYGKKDANLRSMKCRNCAFVFKTDAPLHGSICPRCRYNSMESPDPEWRTLKCNHCGNSYETARLGYGSSFCWRCKILVKEVPEFEWKQPESQGPRQDKPLEYRRVRCKACGLVFETSNPKGAVQCPRESCPESGGHNIEELDPYYKEPQTHGEYGTGETVDPQTMGSMSDVLEFQRDQVAKDKHRFFAEIMEKKTLRMQKDNEKYREDREV